MKVNFNKTKFMDMVNINGKMEKNMKVNGIIIICMVKEHLYTKIIKNILVHMLMINVKVRDNSFGLMVKITMEHGKMVYNTVMEYLHHELAKS